LLVCAHRLGIAGNCDRQRDRKTKSAKKHYFHFRSIVSTALTKFSVVCPVWEEFSLR
jgi:hypothetical protein